MRDNPVMTAPDVTPPTLAKSDLNLVWIDCEMTGLDPERERLIEIAVVITGPDLTPRIEGPVLVIHQPDEVLNAMDAWNKGTHGRSGLVEKVKAHVAANDLTAKQVTNLVELVRGLTGEQKMALYNGVLGCGNNKNLVRFHKEVSSEILETINKAQSVQKK